MIKCTRCGRLTKKKESTGKIYHRVDIEPKGNKTISEEIVCGDCDAETNKKTITRSPK